MFDMKAYGALKDSYAQTYITQGISVFADAGLFVKSDKNKYEYQILGMETKWGNAKYLLPEFSVPNLDKGLTSKTAIITADIKRDLLFPVNVGFSIYDQDDNKVAFQYSPHTYAVEQQWGQNGLTQVFDNLKANTKYFVHPMIKILFKELLATPQKEFTTKEENNSEFDVVYPKYQLTTNDMSANGNANTVVIDFAILPKYVDKDYYNTYAVLYKDGKEIKRTTRNILYTEEVYFFNQTFQREELNIDYNNCIATPKQGQWKVALFSEEIDDKGNTSIVCRGTQDVRLLYNTKPMIFIYKCDIINCDHLIYNTTYGNHDFSIKMNCFSTGNFWRKSFIGNSTNEVNDGKVHCFNMASIEWMHFSVAYTNENIPQQLIIEYTDFCGDIIKSNSIPIYTNSNKCVIESHYNKTSEFKDKYWERWQF